MSKSQVGRDAYTLAQLRLGAWELPFTKHLLPIQQNRSYMSHTYGTLDDKAQITFIQATMLYAQVSISALYYRTSILVPAHPPLCLYDAIWTLSWSIYCCFLVFLSGTISIVFCMKNDLSTNFKPSSMNLQSMLVVKRAHGLCQGRALTLQAR